MGELAVGRAIDWGGGVAHLQLGPGPLRFEISFPGIVSMPEWKNTTPVFALGSESPQWTISSGYSALQQTSHVDIEPHPLLTTLLPGAMFQPLARVWGG